METLAYIYITQTYEEATLQYQLVCNQVQTIEIKVNDSEAS